MRWGFPFLVLLITVPAFSNSTTTRGRVVSGNVDARGGPYRVEGSVGEVFDVLAFTNESAEREDANLDFERDEAPQDGVPDGWTIVTRGGSNTAYTDDEAEGAVNRFLLIRHTGRNQSTAIGRSGASLLKPGAWYRLSFSYRTTDATPFGWRLATADFEKTLNVLGAEVREPVPDNAYERQWHVFRSAPFRLPPEQLARYPMLTLCVPAGFVGTLTIDHIAIEENGARQ